MARKPNPIYKGKRYEPSAKVQRKLIKKALYKERAKALRPYFGDTFKASSGYDLRLDPDKWTPAQKAKITKYWRVIAPQIARPHKARYFRRKDHLQDAIIYTQQEQFLPGQTAALFAAAPDETLEVKFDKRGEVMVRRQGLDVRKVNFDMHLLLEDPAEAIQEALEELEGATRYKIMMGPHESRGTFTRENILDGIQYFIGQYSDDEFDEYDPKSQHFRNWLGGLIGYYGRAKKIDTRILLERERKDADIEKRKGIKVERRRKARAKAKAEQRARRKKRGKKRR